MGNKVVLVVDDGRDFRSFVRTVLQKDGLDVIEAADGIDAYNIVQELGKGVDLLVSDIMMPRMDGVSLAECVRELFPKMPVLLMTARTLPPDAAATKYTVLFKPFRIQALKQAIRKLLADEAGTPDEAASANRAKVERPSAARPGPARSDSVAGPMPLDSDVQSKLESQVKRTRQAYESARNSYDAVLADIPSGLPSPDGAARVQHAGREFHHALQAYTRAVERLSRYLLTGALPDESTDRPAG